MIGCHPIGSCVCTCHRNGISFMLATNPPKPCCACSPLGIPNYIPDPYIIDKPVSPMVEQMQRLEDRIIALEKQVDIHNRGLFNDMHYQYAEDIRKLKIEGDTHCSSIVCLERKVEKLESSKLAEEFNPEVWLHKNALPYLESKKPHKCPSCDGYGEWELTSMEETIANGNKKFKPCKACEGKGILWG